MKDQETSCSETVHRWELHKIVEYVRQRGVWLEPEEFEERLDDVLLSEYRVTLPKHLPAPLRAELIVELAGLARRALEVEAARLAPLV